MVRGWAIALTSVAGKYQCADTQTIARGRGIDLPIMAQPLVQSFCWSAFIGLPCPKKIAGIGWAMFALTINAPRPRFLAPRHCRDISAETVSAARQVLCDR